MSTDPSQDKNGQPSGSPFQLDLSLETDVPQTEFRKKHLAERRELDKKPGEYVDWVIGIRDLKRSEVLYGFSYQEAQMEQQLTNVIRNTLIVAPAIPLMFSFCNALARRNIIVRFVPNRFFLRWPLAGATTAFFTVQYLTHQSKQVVDTMARWDPSENPTYHRLLTLGRDHPAILKSWPGRLQRFAGNPDLDQMVFMPRGDIDHPDGAQGLKAALDNASATEWAELEAFKNRVRDSGRMFTNEDAQNVLEASAKCSDLTTPINFQDILY